MVHTETTSYLENIRKCILTSTTDRSLFFDDYNKGLTIVPLIESSYRETHIKVTYKTSLKKLMKITFVNAKEILGIIQYSIAGNTNLKWIQIKKKTGKMVCKDSLNLISSIEKYPEF